VKKSDVILTSFILLITICITTCARPQSSESPLSPLSPPPVHTRPATATPASTPTSIPSPTWTPWPTPTWTPIPTSTPQPSPGFPLEAVIPEGWPLLPSDLYFLRDGSLWRWPKEGQVLQQIVAAPALGGSSGGRLARPLFGPGPTGVTAYRLTPDERYLVYAFVGTASTTLDPEMIVLDQATGESFPISTATNFEYFSLGMPSFDITPDGRYVVYIAWNVRPTTASKAPGLSNWATLPSAGGTAYGTIFAVDVQNVNREFGLGYCAARSEFDWELECNGFVLSPDGTRIAFSDGRGMWLSEVPQGTPRLIAEHQHLSGFCGVWRVRNWSPDGKHLLIDVGCYEGGYSAVMDVDTGEVREISHTWNYPGPYVDITWIQNGASLLVDRIDFASGVGPAYLVQVSTENPVQESVVISATWPSDVWPTEPHGLPDGRIGFASQQCVDSVGMRPGIYTVGKDGTGLEFVAPLPAMPCYVSEEIHGAFGTVLWSPDGIAYLYFIRDEQRASQANLLLGLTDSSVLWDVRELLADAHAFQWQPPYSGYWR
jgi:hypothetical protein